MLFPFPFDKEHNRDHQCLQSNILTLILSFLKKMKNRNCARTLKIYFWWKWEINPLWIHIHLSQKDYTAQAPCAARFGVPKLTWKTSWHSCTAGMEPGQSVALEAAWLKKGEHEEKEDRNSRSFAGSFRRIKPFFSWLSASKGKAKNRC